MPAALLATRRAAEQGAAARASRRHRRARASQQHCLPSGSVWHLTTRQLKLRHFSREKAKVVAMPLSEACDAGQLALGHQRELWAPGLARIETKIGAACAT